jgi:hypothetical protein
VTSRFLRGFVSCPAVAFRLNFHISLSRTTQTLARTSQSILPRALEMPLVKLQNRGFNGVNQYLQNREVGGAQPEPGQRSLTPQPQRERSKHRANETIEHKPRASSRDAVGGRQGNMARSDFVKGFKMAVPDTIAKAKADQAQPTHHHGSDVVSSTAQHKTSRTDPRAELHHEVSSCLCLWSSRSADSPSLSPVASMTPKASTSMTRPVLRMVKRPR